MRTKLIHAMSRWMLAVLTVAASTAWSQQCADWSPYFNQMDDPAALQKLQSLRSQGWPNFDPANNGGVSLQQSIAQGEQLIQEYQHAYQEAQQAWMQTRGSSNESMNVSAAQCINPPSAHMVAACDARMYRNMLLGVEGMNDLMRCRAGMPPGSYASMPAATGSETTGPFSPAWKRGADSVVDRNIAKRGGMVNSAVGSWQPPTEQQAAQGSLAAGTTLADPFADTAKAAAANSSESENAPAWSGDSGSSATFASSTAGGNNQWSDPLDAATTQSEAGSTQPQSGSTPPTPAEISATLDAGTANAGASEVSLTQVAQVTDSSNWTSFVNPPSSGSSGTSVDSFSSTSEADSSNTTNQQIDRAFAAIDFLTSDALPFGPGMLKPVFQQANKMLDDMDRASGPLFDTTGTAAYPGASFDRLNSDQQGFGPAWVQGVIQGTYVTNDSVAIYQGVSDWAARMSGRIQTSYEQFKNRWLGGEKCDLFSTANCGQ